MSALRIVAVPALASLSIAVAPADAAVIGFHESFAAGAANWRGATSTTLLSWSQTGGPLDHAFVSSAFNLAATQAGGIPSTLIRASASAGSSSLAYAGNWAAEGVTGVNFWFRHDLADSIGLTLRVASPQNYPGASAFDGVLIAPNVWTLVSFDLRPEGGEWISFEGTTYATALSNVGNMQVGFNVPASLAGQNITGHFDMTGFSIVPGPGTLALLALGGVISRRRR
jgi:hypothetical protein